MSIALTRRRVRSLQVLQAVAILSGIHIPNPFDTLAIGIGIGVGLAVLVPWAIRKVTA